MNSGLYGVTEYVFLILFIHFLTKVLNCSSSSRELLNFQVFGPLCSGFIVTLQEMGAWSDLYFGFIFKLLVTKIHLISDLEIIARINMKTFRTCSDFPFSIYIRCMFYTIFRCVPFSSAVLDYNGCQGHWRCQSSAGHLGKTL